MIYLCDCVFGVLAPGLEAFCFIILLVEILDCSLFHSLRLYPLQSLCYSFEVSTHIDFLQVLEALPQLILSLHLSPHPLWLTKHKGHDISLLPFYFPLPLLLLPHLLILKLREQFQLLLNERLVLFLHLDDGREFLFVVQHR